MLQGLSNAAEERWILELRERFLFMTSSLQMSTLWAETVKGVKGMNNLLTYSKGRMRLPLSPDGQ
jgi:hypothetical protein